MALGSIKLSDLGAAAGPALADVEGKCGRPESDIRHVARVSSFAVFRTKSARRISMSGDVTTSCGCVLFSFSDVSVHPILGCAMTSTPWSESWDETFKHAGHRGTEVAEQSVKNAWGPQLEK